MKTLVKPLNWDYDDYLDEWSAHTILGTFIIKTWHRNNPDGEAYWQSPNQATFYRPTNSVVEAKKEAWVYYESRIRSALTEDTLAAFAEMDLV